MDNILSTFGRRKDFQTLSSIIKDFGNLEEVGGVMLTLEEGEMKCVII